MDLFKLGLRNVLGITLPGAISVLVFLYALFNVIFALNQSLLIFSWGKDQQLLLLIIMFLVSYVLGSLMRLNAADKVDKKSAEYYQNKYNKDKDSSKDLDEKKFEDIRKQLLDGHKPTESLKDFDEWIWMKEEFPYPVWQFRKFYLYHPDEVCRFFESYQRCMGVGYGGRGKEFFNYCKMVIYHSGRQLGDALVEEVHFAEAIVRFYAGTYFGLLISFWMLLLLFLFQGIVFMANWESQPALALKVISIIITAILIVAVYLMQQMIVQRFRTLRLKEVDTVYDAFYLIHRHIDNCSICSSQKKSVAPEQGKKNDLINA